MIASQYDILFLPEENHLYPLIHYFGAINLKTPLFILIMSITIKERILNLFRLISFQYPLLLPNKIAKNPGNHYIKAILMLQRRHKEFLTLEI